MGAAGLWPKTEPKKFPTDPKKLLRAGGVGDADGGAAPLSEGVPPESAVVTGGRVRPANSPLCNGHGAVGSVPLR